MMENSSIIPGFDKDRDESLKISLSTNPKEPDILTVFLKGRIDNYNAAFFQIQLDKIFQSEYKKLLFRCSSLEYVSSSGLGVFVNYSEKFKESGGNFVFADVQSRVLEVFLLLGFDRLFCIANDDYIIAKFFEDANKQGEKIFPKIFACPICEANLKALKAGKFRCSKCKTILSVDDIGNVNF